jgi:hypothetical protein
MNSRFENWQIVNNICAPRPIIGGSFIMNRIDTIAGSPREDVWRAWPVSWSAVWVGALTALAALLIIGLIGLAVGGHVIGPSSRILSWREFGLLALAFSVGGAFFSFVAGGWASARLAGILRAEPAMLHGAMVWLVTVPMLLILAGFGSSNLLGRWYGGLGGTPVWVQAPAPKAALVAENDAAKKEVEEAAQATRNSALGALTALLLGLIGNVIGGWLASGEPMTFMHYYRVGTTRDRELAKTIV